MYIFYMHKFLINVYIYLAHESSGFTWTDMTQNVQFDVMAKKEKEE